MLRDLALDRRQLLSGGAALALGLTAAGRVVLAAEAAPEGLTTAFGPKVFDVWVQIGADNVVTLVSPEVEYGQGVTTGLAILVAEELDADWTKMAVVQSSSDRVYANPLSHTVATNASASIRMRFDQMRTIGASAREMLKAAAAEQWKVPVVELTTANGVVSHAASKKSATYGELSQAAAKMPLPEHVALRPADKWKLIGKAVPRLDITDKCTGKAKYASDIRLPGMLHAAVLRSPNHGGTVKSVDSAAAEKRKGVKGVENLGYGVAVVADDAWTARRALEDVKVVWNDGPMPALDSAGIAKMYQTALASPSSVVAKNAGDVQAAAKAGGAKVLEAEYTLPFLHHQCMEPRNSMAHVHDGICEIWTPTASASNIVGGVGFLLGLPPDKVIVHRAVYVGGSFGGRSRLEQEIDAIKLSQKFNAPVQVVTRREHELQYGQFRPYQKTSIKGVIDASGSLVGWQQKVASQSINANTFQELAPAGVDMEKVKASVKARGGMYAMPYDFFAMDGTPVKTPYNIPSVHMEYVQTDLPLPTGHWRSVGISGNTFETEGFIDEMAHLAGADPIAFRKKLLKEKRHIAVLDELAKMIGWKYPQSEKDGWGVAFAEGFTACTASAVQLGVVGKKLVIKRVVAVVDVGTVVTHDQVESQLQGSIIDGLATAFFQEITLKDGKVQQSNFSDYRTFTLAQAPKIEYKIMASTENPGSISELGTPMIMPALTNAVHAVTGTRIRELPIAKSGFSI